MPEILEGLAEGAKEVGEGIGKAGEKIAEGAGKAGKGLERGVESIPKGDSFGDIKSLYRASALRFHPDRALDKSDLGDVAGREGVMSKINTAYSSGDINALRKLWDGGIPQQLPTETRFNSNFNNKGGNAWSAPQQPFSNGDNTWSAPQSIDQRRSENNTEAPQNKTAAKQKKISMVEGLLLLMFVGFVDLLQFFVDFIDGGTISSFIINPPVFFITQFYLTMKGIKGVSNIAGNLVEFVPIVNALPIRTATMMLTIYMANKPAVASIASTIGGKITTVAAKPL